MLRQRLQQKLLQKLSPQQIQMIKLLEIPTMQLEQRIKAEIEDNPALEEGLENNDEEIIDTDTEPTNDNKEQINLDDYSSADEIPDYKLYTSNFSKDDKKNDIPFSIGSTFHDSLIDQLGLKELSEREYQLAKYIIGNIDDDGYLRRNLESIVDDLAFSMNIKTTVEELNRVLEIIHDFEPYGVGARNLQECLLIQLKHKDLKHEDVKLAYIIIKDYFNEFSKKHYEKIIDKLKIDEQRLKDAINVIIKLNPKPGNTYYDPQNKDFEHIIPDFVIENKDGELLLSLNSKNMPDLRLNKEYSKMLTNYAKSKEKNKSNKETLSFVKQKVESAKWFIEAVKQRQNTLLLVMNTILEFQRDYFQEGDETRLRPMILKDIAERTGLDISTISRVVNSKYVQTHFGIFPLKHFFSEGIQNIEGEEISTREIKKILSDCIENEDKHNPLTDDKLVEILKSKGYNIARRTIAKYREQMNIPVARLRKQL
jgi:RNA polymerase sigma-54 factor